MKNEKTSKAESDKALKESEKISKQALKELETEHGIKIDPNPLGIGGFAAVFMAMKDDKRFAIKVIKYSGDENKKARIKEWAKNEALICNNLKHKNTVRAYRVYDLSDAKAIVLELASNKDLNFLCSLFYSNKLFKTHFSHMSESLIRFFFAQIYSSMDYLYQMCFLHSDIKLENFLLTRNFTVKLSDFALSVNIRSNNEFKLSTAGTTTYMAPEIYQGVVSLNDKQAFKIDYYAIGCCLYRLYTGKHVVNVEQDGKTVKLDNLINRLNEIKQGSFSRKGSPELEKLILKLLDPNIDKRGDLSDIKCDWLYKNEHLIRNIHESNDSDYLKFILELQKLDDLK
jgi:5'-AMP-activated protein kinase catalytic alpha subunit